MIRPETLPRRMSIKKDKSDVLEKNQKSSSLKHSQSDKQSQVSEIRFKKKSNIVRSKGKMAVYFGENNSDLINSKYSDNTIRTTKYNFITFLPKSLLFQFQRAANIYFLVISILTCLSFSPKQPSSMIGTFGFVLLCTMIKEAIEDYGRLKQDNSSNNKEVFKFFNHSWKSVKCSTLKPGDIVKVIKEEEFTADVLIIKSSNASGYCYIDTKNLDGETNLKEKCALEDFKNVKENIYSNVSGCIECDKPDENLTSWEGVVIFQSLNIYASLKNIILKGCTLKNTEFAIGIVVYAGHNTKIMKNSKNPRQKVSNVMLIMNRLLYGLFALNILICLILTVLNYIFVSNNLDKYQYIFFGEEVGTDHNMPRFITSFLTFFIGFSQLIPISLYVALEMVKIFQGVLIFYDWELYDIDMKKPALSRTTDLIEELGQVEFIFSDKTGTLTCNNMVLKKCFVNNKIYGMNPSEKEDAKFTINGDQTASQKIMSDNLEDKNDKQKLEDFFTLLALCHSVFPEKTDKGIIYQGSSPDDIALVKGAQQLGIEFASKDFDDLIITNHLTKETSVYTLKCELPFSSDRKRMSVVVQDKATKRLLLLTKGADNVMLQTQGVFKPIITEFENENVDLIQNVLNVFSKEGLRILVMGMKLLDPIMYLDWERRFKELKHKGANLSELNAELECNLTYLGCSAIEDKLQEGVPETISNFLKCGIKIWVLTGDKQDTALEIAKSCKLVDDKMHIIDLSTDIDSVEDRLKEVGQQLSLASYLDDNSVLSLKKINSSLRGITDQNISIIIDGVTLEIILDHAEYSRLFLLIALSAKSVVCCRVSPKQKAKVVQLVKKSGKWVTLSIGDGANDVPMIMEANIGVGIQGNEGSQAARSADYSIGQFRHLEKLLLVYGRNGYVKITKFICYYFYKNIVLGFSEMGMGVYNGFSGQNYFADYLGTMFNAFFTSWPCLFTFILEREHDISVCKKFPILYSAGTKNFYFNLKTFWKYVFYATAHSLTCFYLPTVGLLDQVDSNGTTFNHWRLSTVSFTCIIHTVIYKLFLMSNYWNIMNIIFSCVAILFYYVCLFVLSSKAFSISFQPELAGVAQDILTNPKAILIIIFVPLISLLPDIYAKQSRYNLYPNPSQMLKKYINTSDVKRYLNSESSNINSKKNSSISNVELQGINQHLETVEVRNIFNINKCPDGILSSKAVPSTDNSNTSQVPLRIREDKLNLLSKNNEDAKKHKFEAIIEEKELKFKTNNLFRRSSVLVNNNNKINIVKKSKDRSNSVFDRSGLIENIFKNRDVRLKGYNNPNEINSIEEFDYIDDKKKDEANDTEN